MKNLNKFNSISKAIMGVPRLYPYICKKFPTMVKRMTLNKNSCQVDYLCIDANTLIHKACQIVYSYGQYKCFGSEYNEIAEKSWKKTFELVMSEIKNLTKITIPKLGLFISFDGTAPRGKALQQKSRRYRSAVETESSQLFNPNCISVGTEYIEQLTRFMYWSIREEIQNNQSWEFIKVYFSGADVPGEGEAKIFSFIRNGCLGNSYCVFGNDGDLIILLFASPAKKVYLLREEVEPFQYSFIDMEKIKSKIPHLYTLIMFSFFAGNDFFQISPMFREVMSALDFYFEELDWKDVKELKSIVSTIAKEEPKRLQFIIEHEYCQDEKFRNNTLLSCFDTHTKILDYEKYRKLYNAKCFPKSQTNTLYIQQVVLDYIRTIFWNYKYYMTGIPCWEWSFEHYYPPLMSDVRDYFPDEDTLEKLSLFHLESPVEPFMQLLFILPPQSKSLLPLELENIVNESAELFSSDFVLDFEGKIRDYQAIVLFPTVENAYTKIKSLYQTKKHLLEKYQRNKETKECYFLFDPSYKANFESEYGILKNMNVRKIIEL